MINQVPHPIRNCCWLATLVVLESVQLTLVFAWVLSYFPPPSPLANTVLLEWQALLQPEWEVPIFRFFVVTAFVLMGLAAWRWQGQLAIERLPGKVRFFFVVEAVLTLLLTGAFLRIVLSLDQALILQRVFVALMTLSLLHKIAANEVYALFLRLKPSVKNN
jgi:hypothetical protein